jgi:hypothetical protein
VAVRVRRTWLATGAAAAALSILTGACSDGQVLASDSHQVYLRLPSDWRVFNAQAVVNGNSFFRGMGISPEQYFKGASANPHPKPSDIWSASPYPWAIVEVSALSTTQQQQMSVEGLSNVLIPIDELAEQGAVFQQLSQPQILVNGNMHGSLVSFEYGTGPNTAFDYVQATWVNNSTTEAWVLIAGCSPTCYEADESTINRVVGTFYVADRGRS